MLHLQALPLSNRALTLAQTMPICTLAAVLLVSSMPVATSCCQGGRQHVHSIRGQGELLNLSQMFKGSRHSHGQASGISCGPLFPLWWTESFSLYWLGVGLAPGSQPISGCCRWAVNTHTHTHTHSIVQGLKKTICFSQAFTIFCMHIDKHVSFWLCYWLHKNFSSISESIDPKGTNAIPQGPQYSKAGCYWTNDKLLSWRRV